MGGVTGSPGDMGGCSRKEVDSPGQNERGVIGGKPGLGLESSGCRGNPSIKGEEFHQ